MPFRLIITVFLATFMLQGCAYASQVKFTDKTAVLAIIGESESESQTGRIAVAEVIRHRGSLKGIYGIHAKRVVNHKYSDATYKLAQAAWWDSLGTNYSNNADGWGNASDIEKFKKQSWFKKCVIVAKIDNHYFWKAIK